MHSLKDLFIAMRTEIGLLELLIVRADFPGKAEAEARIKTLKDLLGRII